MYDCTWGLDISRGLDTDVKIGVLVEGLGFHRAGKLNAQLAFEEAPDQFPDVLEGLDEEFQAFFLKL